MTRFVPDDFEIPAGLATEDFRLRMLSETDTEKDYEAVMESQARLRAGSADGWPREGFTLAENRADLERHQSEFLTREAFAYTVVAPDESSVLGCVYIDPSPYPSSDGAVRLWMRESAAHLEPALYERVDRWIREAWPFETHAIKRWGGHALCIRDAARADLEAMLSLMPRLADFDIPPERRPEHLWQDDAELLKRHLEGHSSDCFAQVALDDASRVVGLILVRMRAELLSHEDSAHLEAIVVDESVQGRGIGRQLLVAAERGARARGATSLTLHVFARNTRARALYDGSGYDGELMRYIKRLP